jgi:prepilin-type N-terminal cleavage/methylation domain-containing protein
MRKHNRGFTLVEVMVAMVILSVVALGLGRFVSSFLHVVSTSGARTVASAVAREQMEAILSDPQYPLPNTWVGTATGFSGFSQMRRTTSLTQVTGTTPARDYTIVTVKVTEPTMMRLGATAPDTVNLTAAVAKP